MKKNLCFLILSVLLMMGSVLPVEAAVFNVTKTEDTNDGACDADCSLREAVLACNAAADDTNEIHIPAGTYVLIIGGRGEEIGETGDLDLNISSNGTPLAGKTIILQGAGNKLTIIDANHIDRAIGIHGGNAEIAGVTIRNGQADEFVGFDGIGGAIESVATGRVVLRQSNFEKNRAHDAAGGILIFGADRVEITECNFLDNRAEGNPNTFGGGLSIWDVREAVIGQSLFFKNWASNVGGGIDVFDQGGVGFDGGTTHILNSTISGNFAALGGGGLSNWTSHVNISFSTLQGNEVEAGPFASGANLWSNIFPIELKGTILTNPVGALNCLSLNPPISDNLSHGYNFDDDDSCHLIESTDLSDKPPLNLPELSYLGGLTQVHELTAGSLAIDAVPQDDCLDLEDQPVTSDQRNAPRDENCDLGAFEADASVCGNGILDAGEGCDDQGESATCTAECQVKPEEPSALCRNNVLDPGEECDDGNDQDDDDCNNACLLNHNNSDNPVILGGGCSLNPGKK